MRRQAFVTAGTLLSAGALAFAAACSSSGASGPATSSAPDSAVTSSKAAVEVATQPPLSKLKVTFARHATGLVQPTHVESAKDGLSRLFVTERRGTVRVYLGKGKLQSKPYLDIRSEVKTAGDEEGLLGLAFSPTFSTDHHLWVTYVASNGSLQLSRFTAKSARATSVARSTERKVINVPHPVNQNHNGGTITFAKDGYLYLGTGDGGAAGDPPNNAQNRKVLLGKILRIDPRHSCGGKAYCVPTSNPYAKSTTARHEIWAYGLRNPWRFSADPRTGDLWIADVGQDAYEEIDHIPAGKGGWNLGWSCWEGFVHYNTSRCSSGVTYHRPVFAYSHSLGEAVIGGYVYRGKAYASLMAGRYVFADFYSGRVWVRGPSGAVSVRGKLAGISSFGASDGGEVWATTYDGGLWLMHVKKV